MIFCMKMKADGVAAGLNSREMLQEMSPLWQKMSDEEQKPFHDEAKERKQKYKADLKVYEQKVKYDNLKTPFYI